MVGKFYTSAGGSPVGPSGFAAFDAIEPVMRILEPTNGTLASVTDFLKGQPVVAK
jgi:hypothetical protein